MEPKENTFLFVVELRDRFKYLGKEFMESYLTKVIPDSVRRSRCVEVTKAIKKARGLLERGAFDFVLQEEIPADAKVSDFLLRAIMIGPRGWNGLLSSQKSMVTPN